MNELPPFEDAMARVSEFMAEQGYYPTPCWIFREDFFFSGDHYWLRQPLPADTDSKIHALYSRGRDLGFGVRVNAPFQISQHACCYLHIPESPAEAEVTWSVGLVLSVAASAPEAQVVRNPFNWYLRRWLGRPRRPEESAGYRLPSRGGVAA